jgi:glycosyltransferase involved in cell wall biosynthesis
MREPFPTSPKISVLICTNNFDRYYEKALRSIEIQDFTDFEIVVVANGIGDDEFSLLKEHSCKIARVYRTEFRGITFNRNFGIHHCRAPLVAIMDADDISYPQRLTRQNYFMDVNPNVKVCGTYYENIDKSDKFISKIKLPINNSNIRKRLLWRNQICHPTVIFRREYIQGKGGYSNLFCDDYELWLRLLQDEECHFANIPEVLLGYREPIVSSFRYSKAVYDNVTSLQFAMFVKTGDLKWLLSSFISIIKKFLKAINN